ncbi:hypothetical protein NC653_021804 [Populus alba x Populus x berolinensis]|uniref:Uncharacterized protein n=1 Tax=Populus alba x Populus x berolinensis TaxID=444605 RepID=A0AAD6MPE9_9ROSI|nr:hypothetical protein NC653_021804 [Populus alba x Populus x berolinensis]
MPLDSKNFRMEIPSLRYGALDPLLSETNGLEEGWGNSRKLEGFSLMAVLMLPFYAGRDSMESNYKLDEGCYAFYCTSIFCADHEVPVGNDTVGALAKLDEECVSYYDACILFLV